MTLVPALALAALLAWSGAYGPAGAAPAAAPSSSRTSGNQPAPPPPPAPPVAGASASSVARNASRGAASGGGVTGWRGRRQAATNEYAGWESGRSSRIEPLFADEPRFVLLERRETPGTGGGAAVPLPPAAASTVAVGPDGSDPFWVARGRRRRDGASSASSVEEPFWAARGRRLWLPRETSIEEPFWAARGRRAFAEDLWSRGRRSVTDTPRWRRRQVDSVEEPFWAARGRRGPTDSVSVEEPFWAARGKKGALAFQDLLSKFQWALAGIPNAPEEEEEEEEVEVAQPGRGCLYASPSAKDALCEPSKLSRGKRGSQEFRDLLSKVRPRGASVELDPFWAARGKRGGAATSPALADNTDANFDDDLFWSALEQRTAALAG